MLQRLIDARDTLAYLRSRGVALSLSERAFLRLGTALLTLFLPAPTPLPPDVLRTVDEVLGARFEILRAIRLTERDDVPAGVPVVAVEHMGKPLYPAFQFDAAGHPFPEVLPLLAALSPDTAGWDRLQWFVEPHERLEGRRPIDVWPTDRAAVLSAAQTERWDGRD